MSKSLQKTFTLQVRLKIGSCKVSNMRSCLQKIILFKTMLLIGIVAFSQNTVSYQTVPPTCPTQGNGQMIVTISGVSGLSGKYDYFLVVLLDSDHNIILESKKVPITSATKYGPVTFSGLTHDVRYIGYVSVHDVATDEVISYEEENVCVRQFKKPEFSSTSTMVRGAGCNGESVGQASLDIVGGVEPYKWEWYNSENVKVADGADIASGLGVGTFYAKVTDAVNCVIESSPVTIEKSKPSISASVEQNIVCKGTATGVVKAIVDNAYGKYRVSWYKQEGVEGDFTIIAEDTVQCSVLPAGENIKVYVVDEIGCEGETNVQVTEPEVGLILKELSRKNLLCRDDTDGEISFAAENAIGAVSYSWKDDKTNTEPSRLELAGDKDYTINVIDEAGCEASQTFQLEQPDTKVTVSIENGKQPSCFGYSDGSITVKAVGGTVNSPADYTFEWRKENGGNVETLTETGKVISSIPGGNETTYLIVGFDANGCSSDTTTYSLDQPKSMDPVVKINGTPASDVALNCNAEKAEVELSATGGTGEKSYDWGDGNYTNVNKKDLDAGSYALNVKDANGCIEPLPISIEEPEELVVSIVEDPVIACYGDKGVLKAEVTGGDGSYEYKWSTGSTSQNSGEVGKGDYSISITDGNGCVTKSSYTLTEPDSLTLHISVTEKTCVQVSLGELLTTVTGGTEPYSYAWYEKPTNDSRKATLVENTSEVMTDLDSTITYKLEVTDGRGCVVADSIDMRQIATYDLEIQQKLVSCPITDVNKASDANTNDGLLTAQVTGGYSPFNITWTDGSKTQDFEKVDVEQDFGIVWKNGQAYTGSNPEKEKAKVSIKNIPVGTYTATVLDFRGCVLTQESVLEAKPSLAVRKLSISASACKISSGKATVLMESGTGNGRVSDFKYDWWDTLKVAVASGVGTEGMSVSGLSAQTYNLRVTDTAGCVLDVPFDVVQKTALQVTPMVINGEIHCEGGLTGSAIATAINDNKENPEFEFSWSAGDFDAKTGRVTKLPAGVHTVTVTDEDGCTASGDVEIVESNLLQIVESTKTDVSCFGDSDGSISITRIEGGVVPYSILWNTGATSYNLSNLKTGTYTVTVSDNSGCSVIKEFEITEPEQLSVTVDKKDLKCPGNCDGSVNVNVEGGIAPYQYKWNVDGVTENLSINKKENLCLGDYEVTVVDANGCSSENFKVTVEGRKERLMVSDVLDLINPECGSGPSGKIAVEATGTISEDRSTGYSYYWTRNGADFGKTENSSNTNIISGLNVGTYNLHLTDGTCSFDTSFVVHNTDMTATGSLDYEQSTCAGDEYVLHISNEETAGYHSYEWRNLKDGKLISSGTTAKGLHTGQYVVSAIDNTECEFIMEVDLEEKTFDITLSETDAHCYGIADGSVSADIINMKGTVSYEWYNFENKELVGNDQSINVGAGSYYVLAYDDNHKDCKIQSDTIIVSQPARMVIVPSISKMSYCKDKTGEIMVEVAQGVPPFTYELRKENGDLVAPKLQQLSRTNKFSNLWADMLFTVRVIDADGCVADTTKAITDFPHYTLQGVLTEPVHCIGDATAELQVVVLSDEENTFEPYTYVWAHDASITTNVAKGLSAGNYQVTVTDGRGCVVPYEFDHVSDPDPMTLDFYETPGILCRGGKGNLLVDVVSGGSGNNTYAWYNEAEELLQESEYPEINDLFAGKYRVVVTDVYGCSSDGTYSLLDPTDLDAVFSVKLTECGVNDAVGSVILESISGGVDDGQYRFRWNDDKEWTDFSSNENRVLSGLVAGEYYCTITNSKNPDDCYIVQTMNTNPLLPMSVKTEAQHARCNYYSDAEIRNREADGSLEVTKLMVAAGDYSEMSPVDQMNDYTFLWNDPLRQSGRRALNLTAGNYEVTVIGPNGCSNTFPASEVGANINLMAEIVVAEDSTRERKVICFGDSLELTAAVKARFYNGYMPSMDEVSFSWEAIESNRSARISNPSTLVTTVTPLSKYYNDSTLIRMTYQIDGCYSQPSEFSISHFDSVGFAIEVVDTVGNIKGSDSVRVIKDFRYFINPVEEPWYANKIEDAGIDFITWRSYKPDMLERGAFFDTVTNAKTYARSGNYGLLVPITEAEYIYAVAQTTNGCIERTRLFVDVYSTTFIPTGFTPNGDGINDTWVIPYLANCPNAKVTVFNRWGTLVYENKFEYYSHPWNGTASNGNALPMGTYYYVIEYKDKEHTPTQTGSVSIIR